MKLVREALKAIREARTGLLLAATAVATLGGPEVAPPPSTTRQEATRSPGETQKLPKPSSARASAQEATGGLREATVRLSRLTG
jgi:hypothetical protein